MQIDANDYVNDAENDEKCTAYLSAVSGSGQDQGSVSGGSFPHKPPLQVQRLPSATRRSPRTEAGHPHCSSLSSARRVSELTPLPPAPARASLP